MANALLTGVAGLNSHQKMLEVIGNNLANMSSTAYKSQRVLFSDLLYETVSAGSAGAGGSMGGINPSQIGSGSQIAQIDSNFSQGNLEPTGQPLDFAIDGDGFFVVQAGGAPSYTRAGSFRVDASGKLVDPATGYRVQRTGEAGEPNGVDPAFQIPGDNSIYIPFGASIPGKTTANVTLQGNVSSDAVGPATEKLKSNTGFTTGGVAATASTLLDDLDSNLTDYAAGDSLLITGTDMSGAPVNTSLAVDGSTTLGDVMTALGAAYPESTASLDPDGSITLTSNTTGEAFLSLQVRDAATNTGGTNFGEHPMVVAENGREGTKVLGGFEVFDVQGKSHSVRTEMQKQADGSWSLTASMDDGDGAILDNRVDNIRFADDGSFVEAGGVGTADTLLSFQFNNITMPQTVNINFGTPGSYDGVTQLAAASSVAAEQDGYESGTLVDVRVNSDGLIQGVATNGRSIDLAQLAIASFRNPSGLDRAGNNYYAPSLASGDPDIGTALSGDRGSITSNHLERSNVDIAVEFTRLIIAQRGFSANARTITVTDEVLQELTQLIR
jgi:flagellar hook protein FlgE